MAGIEIHDNVKTEPEHIYTAIELKANQGLDGANERPKLTHEVDDTTKVSKYVCMTHTKQKMLLLVCVIACIMLSLTSLIVTILERDEAIDGSWNGWAQWGACSSTCDVGMQMRQRSCSNPYPSGNGHQCLGADIEQRLCYSDSCSEIESVDGSWSAWNSWEACSTTCNIGIQTRNRNCSNSAPSGYGRQCLGVDSEQRLCKLTQCSDEAIDGSWNGWAQWGACSSTCEVGMQIRQRNCSNPKPSGNGRQCLGANIEQRVCSSGSCSDEAIDGSWNGWAQWGSCSSICDVGMQIRQRNCSNPSPSGNGRQCLGVDIEQRLCFSGSCSDIWFRTTVGIGKASATAWETGKGATNTKECLNVRKDGCILHYRDPRIDTWSQQKISKVRYSIYKNEQEVVWVLFNATGSTMNNWFDKSRVIGSSYTDLTSSVEYNFFAIQPIYANIHDNLRRHWYVSYNWNGCENDDIWFVTADASGGGCYYEKLAPYPYIMYSMKQTRASTKLEADFGLGDVAVVKVIQEE